MSDQGENINSQVTLQFSGVDFDVEVFDENEVLEINVENCSTCDHWTGKYDASYIEELTHKTGNYKQFHIFCNMLESALVENCQSVTLDLLTYEDLKILREQKHGGTSSRRKQKHVVEEKLKSKRYLIMTYTVEFDQIHYPLPLMYTGVSDTATLKEQIKKLRNENQSLRCTRVGGGGSTVLDSEDYEKTMQENIELKEELGQCHQKMQDISNGNFNKELKVLKKVIQNLETELVKERSKHQRLMMKKKKEYDEILQELQDVKASERNYRVRCKNLTEELSIMKKNSRCSPAVNTRKTQNYYSNNRSASRDRFQNTSQDRGRSRNMTSHKQQQSQRKGRPPPASRSVSRDRERSLSAGSSIGRRTPSPGGYRRFDPSANSYIKEKEQKRKESEEINRSRRRTPSSNQKRSITPLSNRSHQKPPISSTANRDRFKSRRSSSKENTRPSRGAGGGSDTDNSITRLRGRNSRPSSTKKKYEKRSKYSDSEDEQHARKKHLKTNKSKNTRFSESDVEEEDNDHAIGIAEIDARLEALQNFMKNTMES